MFFSRVRLNPTRRGTMKFLASPQALHAVVMGSCGPSATQQNGDGRILWRVDRPEQHVIELYVVSPTRPDFTGLIEQAGWPTAATWDTAEYSPLLDRLNDGQHWRFRLTANPIHRVRPSAGSGRARVSPHRTRRHQEQWLIDHAKGWGFAIPAIPDSEDYQVAVIEREQRSFARRDPASEMARRRVDITRASYLGVLEVVDAGLLRHSMTHGIGRAKAYGCGLITLAPVG